MRFGKTFTAYQLAKKMGWMLLWKSCETSMLQGFLLKWIRRAPPIQGYKNSKTSPGALFKWEAWEVILGAKIVLFLESTNIFEDFL